MSEVETKPEPKRLQHRHAKEERRTRQQDGTVEVRRREVKYSHACAGCVAADKERLKKPSVSADRLASTIFLTVRSPYEQGLVREFLLKRYPEINLSQVRDYVPIQQLASMLRDDVQLVTVVRRGLSENQKGAKPGTRIVKTDNGGLPEDRPFSDLMGDLIESAPISIRDCVDGDPDTGVIYSGSDFDTAELVERLSEVAYPAVVFRMDADKQIVLKDS